MLTNNLTEFIQQKLDQLSLLNIDVSNLELDHFAFQCSSTQDYENLKPMAQDLGIILSENIVNGRRVGIYKLKKQIVYLNYNIVAFELVEPKENQICESKLDHIEFVLKESFQDFINKYPSVEWDTVAINREEFPKLTLKLEEGTSVKFHLKNIIEEI
jgi:predicted metalloenzyme YecM